MNDLIKPFKPLSKNAKVKNMCEYYDLVDEFKEDYYGTWGKLGAEKIDWFKPFDKVFEDSKEYRYKWFLNGKLNVSYQCIDRHLKDKKNKVALVFEGENHKKISITYLQLYRAVNRFANLLKNVLHIKKGDVVVIYMPMIPQAVYAMLACARVGAIHSVVFGGFSAEALRDRIQDAKAKVVITADGAFRRGKPYMLKPILDEALQEGCECVKNTLVILRNNEPIDIKENDIIYNEVIYNQSYHFEPVPMDSEDLLFLLYTSGSTGKPKGIEHTQAGYILWAQMTMEYVFDIKDKDVYWCSADIGWITGHTYVVYGPLSSGATTLIYEGVPTYPDTGRFWQMIEYWQVSKFYTAPTAIRMLYKDGKDEPKKYDLSSLQILGTVGEPINPSAWEWYYDEIGDKKCSIVDTYWQTETGGHIVSPLPGATPIKPSCATLPLPGIIAEILDEDDKQIKDIGKQGAICVTKPWPSMLRGVWGDKDRFVKTYFNSYKKDDKFVYFTGDGGMYDENGYITVTGRVDDIINIAGHNIGTAEVESAITKHKYIAECAVVSILDSIKGEQIFAYLVLKNSTQGYNIDMLKEVNGILAHSIGKIVQVSNFAFVKGLPKTRSGKIMRRILRSIARGEEIKQDISTLDDSSIVESIINTINKNK